MAAPDTFVALAAQLAEVGRLAYARGWALGTSGNFSAVVARAPLTLAITPSGVDKGLLEPGDIVEIDAEGAISRGSGKPSAETAIHVAVARTTGAGAVLHTHSIWSTILSARADGGNFSAVVGRAPLTLAITRSGVDKGLLEPGDIVEIDAEGGIRRGSGKPSAETD